MKMGDLDYETKMQYKLSNIEKRNLQREENISQMRTQEAEKGNERVNDKVAEFYGNLDPQVANIKEMMEKAQTMDKHLLPAHLDELLREVNVCQKYVTDSTMYLPPYDTKNAQRTMNDLHQKFQDLQSSLMPKKKFGFKGLKQKKTETKTTEVAEPAGGTAQIQLETGISVRDKVSETVELGAAEVNSADVNLVNLENCRIMITGSPSTLHITHVRNCRIIAGPVSSSVFIEDCRNSTLVLSSQQLRVHNTTDTEFLIHVTSKAVIEDCSQLRFGAHPLLDEISVDVWTVSGLDRNVNNWDQVGDFNWLAKDKESPHWSRLETTPNWSCIADFLKADN